MSVVIPSQAGEEYNDLLISLIDFVQEDKKGELKLYVVREFDSNQTKFETLSNSNKIGVFARSNQMGVLLLHCLRTLIDGEQLWVFDELPQGEPIPLTDALAAILDVTEDNVDAYTLQNAEKEGIDLEQMSIFNWKQVKLDLSNETLEMPDEE